MTTDASVACDPTLEGLSSQGAQRTFVVLSTTDYDAPQFGSRQQIALRLARRGHRVLFVEVPRALHSFWTDPAAARAALGRAGRVRPIAPRLFAFTPSFVLPLYYNRLTNSLNQRLLVRGVRRALATMGWAPDVVWTYWPNSAHLVKALGACVSVYHCIDDFVAGLAAGPHPFQHPDVLRELERELMSCVDAVAVRSAPLAERSASCARRTWSLPGGVDPELFDSARPLPVPPSLEALPGPRIGWVGTLDDRVDVDLIARCADALPNASFVLVGPLKAHRIQPAALSARSNVYLLPACAHDAVPAYLAALDVGLLPYLDGAHTRALSPVKLHEMLAMGLPFVSTPVPYVEAELALLDSDRRGAELLDNEGSLRAPSIAHDASSFVSAIEAWLARPPSAGERSRWRDRAVECSWDAQVVGIERRIQELRVSKTSRAVASETRADDTSDRVALQVLASSRGGGAVHVRALIPGLIAQHYALELAVPDDEGHLNAADFESAGAKRVVLPRSSLGRIAGLVKRLRKESPAVVHAHGARAGLESAIALRVSGARSTLLVVTLHGYATPYRPQPRKLLQRIAERWLARRVNLFFAVCEAERLALVAAGFGNAGRLRRLDVGYPLQAFESIDDSRRRACRASLRDGEALGPTFLTVCRLDDPRDLATLAEAFCRARAKLGGSVLWVVGDGPRRAALERQLARLGAGESVRLLGFRRDVPDLMAAADVFVLTTEAHEGLPIALLEAQAAGLPVIATDAGGAREAMCPESGVLVPRADVAALASSLEALGLDPERRVRMGEAGRKFVNRFADADRMAAEVAAAYREFVA